MLKLGAFEALRPLAQGGSGQIWYGRHGALGTPVAIKALRAAPVGLEAWWPRLHTEARALAGLDHPHIIAVYDLLLAPAQEGHPLSRQACMVMEYARHGSMTSLRGALPWPQLAPLLRQLLQGLAHLHARGLLHLDLKPQNLLLRSSQRHLQVLISDFGLSRAAGPGAPPGASAGTPGYMAPEQRAGHPDALGPWSDLYALGICAWELLTGQRPPQGAALPAHPAVPAPLLAWLRRCTALAPQERFALAALALRALEGLPHASAPAPALGQLARLLPEDIAAQGAALAHADPSLTLPVDQPMELDLEEPEAASAPSGAPGALSRAVLPGQGLHRARELALVGRRDLRQALWEQRPRRQAGARALCLVGPQGVGRRRLALDLAHRAEALGQARNLQVPEEIPHEVALLAWLARRLLPHGQRRDQALDHWLKDHLAQLGLEDPYTRALLARLLGEEPGQADPEALRQASWALLRASSLRLPLIVLLPARAWPWLRWMTQAPQEASLLLLWTSERSPAEDSQRLPVPPLPEAEMLTLVHRRLQVQRALAHEVVRRAQGNPGFATRLLESWLSAELLDATPTGLALRPGESLPALPADSYEVWRQAAQAALRHHPEGAREALTLAAILGPQPRPETLERACQLRGVQIPNSLLEQGHRAGWLRSQGRGWGFAQPALRQALLQMARAQGQERALRQICLQALLRDAPPEPLRVAELLLDGDQVAQALPWLQRATERGADIYTLQALLERAADLEPRAPLEQAQRWALQALRAQALFYTGQSAAALGLTQALPQEALDQAPRLAFDLLRFELVAALSRGQHEVVERGMEKLERLAQALDEPEARLKLATEQGRRLLMQHQDAEAAARLLDQALRREAPVSWRQDLVTRALLGVALLERGALEESARHNQQGAAQALARGHRMLGHTFLNNQAQALHQLGRLEQAHACYLRALEAAPEHLPMVAYLHLNLVVLDTQRGQSGSARARLEELAPQLGQDKKLRLWLFFQAAAQLCYAAELEAALWDQAMGALEEAARDGGPLVPETAALLRQAATSWAAHQDPGRQHRALALAQRL